MYVCRQTAIGYQVHEKIFKVSQCGKNNDVEFLFYLKYSSASNSLVHCIKYPEDLQRGPRTTCEVIMSSS